MTSSRSLDSYSFKELCALAKRLELNRWTHLRKEDLLAFLQERVEAESNDKPKRRTRKTASAEEAEPAVEPPQRRRSRNNASVEPLLEPQRTLFDVNASDTEPAASPSKQASSTRARRAKRASESVQETALLLSVEVEEAVAAPTASEKKTRNKSAKRAAVAAPVEPVPAPRAEETAPKKARQRRVKAESAVEEEVVAPVSVESSNPKIVDEASKKKSRRKPTSAQPVEQETPVESAESTTDAEPAPKKRARRSAKQVEIVEPELAEAEPPAEEAAPKKRARRSAKQVEPEAVEPAVDAEPAPKKRARRSAKQVEIVESESSEPEPLVEEAAPKKRARRSTKRVESEAVEPAVDAEPTPKERERRSAKKAKAVEPELAESEEPVALEDEPEPKKENGKKSEPELFASLWEDDEDDIDDSDDNDDDRDNDEDEDDIPEWREVEDDDRQSATPVALPEPEPSINPPSEQVLALREKLITRKIVGSPNDRADRIVLFVCDSFWLRACWEVTPLLVDRIRSAMGKHWHTADPALRVFHVDREGPLATGRRELVSELAVSGGFGSWYIPIDSSPNYFMVELGYRTRDGQFFTLISSNTVQTPQRFANDSFGRSMIDDLNARARLESSTPYDAAVGFGAKCAAAKDGGKPVAAPPAFPAPIGFNQPDYSCLDRSPSDEFYIDVEIVIKGHASPRTTIMVKDDPIAVRVDNTFTVRYSMPERRHVFPIVMTSQDGMEKQTIVLALDRNTKKMDPVFKEDDKD